MAFKPIGVAALSNPSIFAAIFITIDPFTGWFLGIEGINFEKKGDTIFDNTLIIPPFSPIFIIPSHNVITPVSPNDNSKPNFAISKVLCTILLNTTASPEIKAEIDANTNAIINNPNQI